MVTTQDQSLKAKLLAKRMEPHLIRQHADLDKLLNMLAIQATLQKSGKCEHSTAKTGTDTARTEPVDKALVASDDERQAWCNELERNESYEAKVAHALLRLAEQIEW